LATWKFVFKLKSSPIFTFNMVNKTLWWPTCFHKEFNFGTKMLFLLLIRVQILHFTWITLPSKPNTNSTHKSSLFNYLRSAHLTNMSSFLFHNFNVLDCHFSIHNCVFKLFNMTHRNIIKWIIIKRSNINGKNFVITEVLIFEFLRCYSFDMSINRKMTKDMVTTKQWW
jgi:hypothetical protein